MFLTANPAVENSFDIDAIKAMLEGVDPAALIPEVSTVISKVTSVCRIAVLIAPVVLMLLGLSYLLFAPKEANYYFGYRTTFGMGSVTAWRRTQKVAGFLFTGLGLAVTVFMVMFSATFGGMETMDMVWASFKCLVAECIIFFLANLSVSFITAATFDYSGRKRKK